MTDPYPKSRQLARGAKRYRRKVASAKQWQAIVAAKIGPCRVCNTPGHNGVLYGRIEFHHLLSRAALGDDVADNIVPLCPDCHAAVTTRDSGALQKLACSLTDGEYAYIVGKLGEGAIERLFGVNRG